MKISGVIAIIIMKLKSVIIRSMEFVLIVLLLKNILEELEL